MAQSPVLVNFTIKDGLASNETYSVYQDKKGFIWICTDAGLVKYDANTFKTFNSTDGLPDNTVFEVKEDKLGRVWFRTYSGNLGYVLNDSVYTIAANNEIVKFQTGGIISSFCFDEENNLYLGRQSFDVITFMKIASPYTANNVDFIYADSLDSVWINVLLVSGNELVYSEQRPKDNGNKLIISVYNNENKLIFRGALPGLKSPSALSRLQKRGDYLIFANDIWINEIDLKTKLFKTQALGGPIINIYKAKSGDLIVGQRDKGIRVFKKGNFLIGSSTLLNNLSNSCVLEDNNGGVWYATLKNGVFYTNNINYKMYEGSNYSNKPVSFFKPFLGNKFIVGLEGGGCFLYEINDDTIKLTNDLNSKERNMNGGTRGYLTISDQTSFLSYTTHSHLYDHKAGKVVPISNKELANESFADIYLYESYLLGYGYFGATVFDPVNFKVIDKIRSKDRITSFAFDPKLREAYFGALHGLYLYKKQTEITDKDRVMEFRVKDLEFMNHHLMIATKGFGLVVKTGQTYDTIGIKNGLLSNVCEKIVVDGNRCWVSSSLGLSCITYFNYKYYDIVNYPLKDFGTPSLIQDFFLKDSLLYLASGSYLYKYPLKEQQEYKVPFYIYKLEANSIEQSIMDGIELNYDQSNIKISFGALYYNFTGKINYRYKLLPNDNDWTYINENTIVFPSLSANSYSLIIEAQKNDGSWIRCPQKITFTINKPFWRSLWFVLCMILLGLLIVSLVFYISYDKKVKRMLLKDKIKMRLYNLEIKAMKAQMNPHFIFNSLNSIQQFILSNENENAYKYLSKFSKLVRKLLESNVNEALSIETEVDILNKYLAIEALRFKDSFTYEIIIEPGLELKRRIPHMMIQPFVENAIWYGLLPKDGVRELKIIFTKLNEKQLQCVVEDNGIGIEKSKLMKRDPRKEKSLALEFIKERLALFSGTMKIIYTLQIQDKSLLNVKESGTKVTIVMPLFDSETNF